MPATEEAKQFSTREGVRVGEGGEEGGRRRGGVTPTTGARQNKYCNRMGVMRDAWATHGALVLQGLWVGPAWLCMGNAWL